MTSLSFFTAAADQPGAIALVDHGRAWRYGELVDEVRDRASRQARDDDGPLAVVAEPTRAALVDAWAALAIGRTLIPLHPRWPDSDRVERVAIARGGSSDAAAVLFTSGTTGRPRGVELSAAALVAAATASASRLGWHDDDRWWLALPWAHVGGLSIITRCLVARRAVVLGALETLERDRVTLASLVPTQLARAAAAGEAPSSLRAVLVGGAPASASLVASARARGWPVRVTYGLTEACSQVATQAHPDDPGCGLPLPGIAVRVRNDAIEVSGPTLCTRFLPDGTAPDAWLATNDRGVIDRHGCVHVLGRVDDVIVTGGEKVAPEPIEDALASQAGVRAACVFGVADSLWGQVVAAVLACEAEVAPQAIAAVAAQLAPHARPRRYAVVDALPTSEAGKVSRSAVRSACTSRLREVQASATRSSNAV